MGKELEQVSLSNAVGYAILAVDIDNKKNFLDFYIPMVAECIRVSGSEHIEESQIAEELKKIFGIKLPLHVIHSTLKRLKKKQYLTYDSSMQMYRPNYTVLDESNFKEIQTKVLENHAYLIKELKQFLKIEYNEILSYEQVELIFENYLNNALKDFIFDEDKMLEKQKITFIISKFIKNLKDTHSPLFQYYESIFIGNMLSTAVYYTEIDKFQQKFKDTKIYFDTTFIIYALGYAGENKKAPAIELISLLREQNAILRCFQHTVEEIKDILHGCIQKVQNNEPDRWGTVSYFVSKKFKKSDIQTIIFSLDQNIEKQLRIKIEEKPSYEPSTHNISEQDLKIYLEKGINYRNQTSIQRDIDSLHAIVRLRKGNNSSDIERSKAIFVTTNNRLSYVASQYFKKDQPQHLISPIISDYILTTTQWIKNPSVHASLPQKRIIADCIAALQPSDRLISKYKEKIEEMKKQGLIDENQYLLLRTAQAHEVLMGKTFGDEDALQNVDIIELSDLTIEKIREQDKEALDKNELKIKEIQEQSKSIEETFTKEIDSQKLNNELLSLKNEKIHQVLKTV